MRAPALREDREIGVGAGAGGEGDFLNASSDGGVEEGDNEGDHAVPGEVFDLGIVEADVEADAALMFKTEDEGGGVVGCAGEEGMLGIEAVGEARTAFPDFLGGEEAGGGDEFLDGLEIRFADGADGDGSFLEGLLIAGFEPGGALSGRAVVGFLASGFGKTVATGECHEMRLAGREDELAGGGLASAGESSFQ